MAEEPEKNPQEPDLELPPLLGFGRKKKARAAKRSADEVVPGDDPLAADPVPPPAAPASPAPSASAPRGGLAPAAGAGKRRPPVPPPTRTGTPAPPRVSDPPPAPQPETQPEAQPRTQPETQPDSQPEPVAAEPVAAAVPEPPRPDLAPGQTEETVVFEPYTPVEATAEQDSSVAVPPRIRRPRSGATAVAPEVEAPPSPDTEETTPLADAGPRARRTPSVTLPVIDPRIAAVISGAVVGLVTVLLAYLSNRGCEGVRGVGSCGGFGLLALLVIVAVGVVLGATLLRGWRVTDPTSAAFLGVGLMAVFVLLFLLGSLESGWMLLVIPVVTAVCFAISTWVTATFVEDHNAMTR